MSKDKNFDLGAKMIVDDIKKELEKRKVKLVESKWTHGNFTSKLHLKASNGKVFDGDFAYEQIGDYTGRISATHVTTTLGHVVERLAGKK